MLPQPEIDFRRTPVTLIIAAVAVALEVVCTLDPSKRAFFSNEGGLGILSTIWSGQLWRPFTTTLLHGGLIHVAFNVYWLLTFGRVLEPRFGSFRFLGLLVLLAYLSSMVPFLVNNLDTPLDGQIGGVGLSGIGYGLFGLLWVGRRWQLEYRYACNDDIVRLFVIWFFVCIALTYANIWNISNFGHGTGLAFGALYAMALYAPHRRIVWRVVAVLLSVVVLMSAVACPGHPLYEKHMRLERIKQLQRQLDQASATGSSTHLPE